MSDDLLDLDEFDATTSLPRFEFKLGAKTRSLPNIQDLTPSQALRVDRGELEEVLTEISDVETAELIMNSRGTTVDRLIDRWQKQSKIKRGESAASSRS